MQALIKVGPSQYFVSPGDEIKIPHVNTDDKTLTFSEVLLTIDGEKVAIGRPFLPKVKVLASVVGIQKDKKVRTLKYKAKSRYRKVTGHRTLNTKIKISEVRET